MSTVVDILRKYKDFNSSFLGQSHDLGDNYVLYIVVNGELKMKKGKIASQVGHAVSKITEYCTKYEGILWSKYKFNRCPKIVLKTENQEELLNILESTQYLHKSYVVDEGRTQISPGSLTAIGYIPFKKEDTPECISALKLL